jgi:hypothetical protein
VRRAARWSGWVAALILAVLWAAPAAACPVCYGEASGGVIDGTKLSVAFLGSLVYLVLFAGVGMVFMVRRRALKLNPPADALRRIEQAEDVRADRPRPAGEETSP